MPESAPESQVPTTDPNKFERLIKVTEGGLTMYKMCGAFALEEPVEITPLPPRGTDAEMDEFSDKIDELHKAYSLSGLRDFIVSRPQS